MADVIAKRDKTALPSALRQVQAVEVSVAVVPDTVRFVAAPRAPSQKSGVVKAVTGGTHSVEFDAIVVA